MSQAWCPICGGLTFTFVEIIYTAAGEKWIEKTICINPQTTACNVC